MKILIIGKNGQVGSSLVERAKHDAIDFIATTRDMLDVTCEQAVKDFFAAQHDFDFVINAAAYTNVDGAESDIDAARAANHLAVKYLATVCAQYGIPLIHISTDYIFDGKKVTGYHEDDLPNPKNIYGLTKLEGENALKAVHAEHIILRVSWVFSEYGKNFVKTMATLSEKRDSLSVVCDQFGAPTSAKSIANTIIHICKTLHDSTDRQSYWGVYHFTDFPVTNWHQFASHVIRMKQPEKNIEIKAIESKDYPTAAERPKHSILNIHKIKCAFNINPDSWMDETNRIITII